MSVTAILQARMSSSRLPGKALKPLLGKPMLERQVERLLRSRRITTLVLATSSDKSDDPLAELCARMNVACFRGSLNDVLDRFYQAACAFPSDTIVRLTGDCPLADPDLIDRVITHFEESRVDYASNTLTPTFPDGLDAEVFSFEALRTAWQEARLPSEREHVTSYLYKHPNQFRLACLRYSEDLSSLRWTVDESKDFEFVESVYQALYPSNPTFSWTDVLAWVRAHPEKQAINSEHERNEGYQRSLKSDPHQGVSSS